MTDCSFLFDAETRGGHVHVSVRVGPAGHDRALCGSLIMEPDEWALLRRVVETGRQAIGVGPDWNHLVEVRHREAAEGP